MGATMWVKCGREFMGDMLGAAERFAGAGIGLTLHPAQVRGCDVRQDGAFAEVQPGEPMAVLAGAALQGAGAQS